MSFARGNSNTLEKKRCYSLLHIYRITTIILIRCVATTSSQQWGLIKTQKRAHLEYLRLLFRCEKAGRWPRFATARYAAAGTTAFSWDWHPLHFRGLWKLSSRQSSSQKAGFFVWRRDNVSKGHQQPARYPTRAWSTTYPLRCRHRLELCYPEYITKVVKMACEQTQRRES